MLAGAQPLDHRVGERDAGDLDRTLGRDLDEEQRSRRPSAASRPSRPPRRRRHLEQRIGRRAGRAAPTARPWRAHPLDQPLRSSASNLTPITSGARACTRSIVCPRSHRSPEPSEPVTRAALLHASARLLARLAGEVRRRHVGRPWCPLGVGLTIGEVDHLGELLVAQAPLVGGGGDSRQRLERASGLDLLPHGAGRIAVAPDRHVDLAALVEHAQGRRDPRAAGGAPRARVTRAARAAARSATTAAHRGASRR